MKIYSSNIDYTSLLSAYTAQQRTSQSTASTDTSQSKTTAAVTALMKRLAPPDMGSSIMGLSSSGQKVKDSIQRPEPPSEEMKAAMDKLRTDFDTIQSADLDTVSSEDAKAMLEQLITDMGGLPGKSGTAASTDTTSAIDVSSLTDTEMKDMLQKIKDQLENGLGMGGAPPPPPADGTQGMMWGFDPSGLLSDSTSEDTAISSTNSSEMAQQLIDLLTESYDSTSQTSSDYAAELKEKISAMLEKQKSSMDDFTSALYTQLDAWSGTQ